MDKKTIDEQTSLALFEGAIKKDHCHYMIPALNRIVWVEKMLYSSDYNWLFRIVEKIENLGYWFNRIYGDIQIIDSHGDVVAIFNSTGRDIKEATYNACVTFVEWFNKKQDGSN